MDIESTSAMFPGAVIRRVLFSNEIPNGWELVSTGSGAFRRSIRIALAPLGRGDEFGGQSESSGGLTMQLLTLPDASAARDLSSGVATTDALRLWVSAGDSVEGTVPLLIQLQGVLICAGPARIAISGTEERIRAVTGAALEFFWLDSEVRRLERVTGDRWEELEEDTPAAFELTESLLNRRVQLQARFQQMISSKATVARLAPMIECPATYPPTLASQAGERLREKSRLGDRLQFLREQVDVFEKVYELCGQRVSDFVSSRKSHLLEWIIIVLLAFETLLLVVDLLGTAAGT